MTTRSNHEPSATTGGRSSDLALVERILGGDIAAWHGFIEDYIGLMRHAVAGLLFDEEDIETTTIDILSRLRESRLATYRGESALSTWLVVVARNATRDVLRRRYGRRSATPAGLELLSARDQRIFRYYYLDGLGFEGLCHRLGVRDHESGRVEVAEALGRIEDALTERTLRRLLWDLSSRGTQDISRRLMGYLDDARAENAHTSATSDPELALIRREARRTAKRILDHVDTLPPTERRILDLRHRRGWTAREIARKERLRGSREVFTILDRVRRQLRRRFGDVLP